MTTSIKLRGLIVGLCLSISNLPLLAEPYDLALKAFTNQCNKIIELDRSRKSFQSNGQMKWVYDRRILDAHESASAMRDVLHSVVHASSPTRQVPRWVSELEKEIIARAKRVRDPGEVQPGPTPITIRSKVVINKVIPLAESLYMIQASTEDGISRRWLQSDGAEQQLELTEELGTPNGDGSDKTSVKPMPSNSLDEQAEALKLILSKMNKGGIASLGSLTNSLSTQALLFIAGEGLPKDAPSKSSVIDALRSHHNLEMKSKGFDPFKESDRKKFSATDDFRSGLLLKPEALKLDKKALEGMAPKGRER